MGETEIGVVTHYFGKIGVAVIKITNDSLKVGDTIHVKGATSDFQQKIKSMEIDRNKIEEASAGQSIGLKTKEPVRENDKVFKVVE